LVGDPGNDPDEHKGGRFTDGAVSLTAYSPI
jgi:hypothetical protein